MDVAAYCLDLPGAEETYPFDPQTTVMKVGGKMFALMDAVDRPPSISLKCDPTRAMLLRQEYPAVQPGYHLNKTHWNTIALDGTVADGLIGELIRHSYDLVHPKPKPVRTAP